LNRGIRDFEELFRLVLGLATILLIRFGLDTFRFQPCGLLFGFPGLFKVQVGLSPFGLLVGVVRFLLFHDKILDVVLIYEAKSTTARHDGSPQ